MLSFFTPPVHAVNSRMTIIKISNGAFFKVLFLSIKTAFAFYLNHGSFSADEVYHISTVISSNQGVRTRFSVDFS